MLFKAKINKSEKHKINSIELPQRVSQFINIINCSCHKAAALLKAYWHYITSTEENAVRGFRLMRLLIPLWKSKIFQINFQVLIIISRVIFEKSQKFLEANKALCLSIIETIDSNQISRKTQPPSAQE